jgi:hypothetical protein
MSGDQTPYRNMLVAALRAILAYNSTFPNLYGILENCANFTDSWANSNAWWIMHDIENAGFGPADVKLEIHFYPYWTGDSKDSWEVNWLSSYGYNTSTALGSMPLAVEQGIIQHRLQQGQDWHFNVFIGEYGYQEDHWGGAVAKIAVNLGVDRYRWVIFDVPGGTYSVLNNADPNLGENGSKDPRLELVASDPSAPIAGHTYGVINVHSGLAMDDWGGAVGQAVYQYSFYQGANQQWKVSADYNTHLLFENSVGNYLEDWQGSRTPGAVVAQNSYSDAATQEWDLSAVGDGSFNVVNVNSGLNLDDKGWGNTNGAPIDLWSATNGSNQHWKFVLIQ